MIKKEEEMVDNTVGKFFETLFWTGALLIFASFFYPRWFMITMFIGIALMIITVIREGFRLKRAKTFTGIIKKNEPQVAHRLVFIIGVAVVFVYLLSRQTLIYNFIAQIYDLTISPAITTWWVFVLTGIIIGLLILFLIIKLKKVKYAELLEWTKSKYLKLNPKGQQKEKKTEEKRAVSKKVISSVKPGFFSRLFQEEEGFWRKILKSLTKKFKKRRTEKLEEKKDSAEQLREKKFEDLRKKAEEKIVAKETKHKTLPRIITSLFICAITIILILHKKGKFSIADPISMAILGLAVGLFSLYILIGIRNIVKEKRIVEKKEEKVVIKKIKEEVVARASKYETDLDKLYKLVNEVGSLTLTEVAEGFDITKEQAEEWGKMLESHDMIELNYPAIGELQLCKKKSKITE